MIDSRKLRHFKVVAELGNVNEAAEQLHISQPALSRSIQNLEASLGLSLFDRSQRSIRLSSAGTHLLSHARTVLLEIENLERQAERYRGLETGSLMIGSGPLPADHIGAKACARFLKEHPDFHVSLQVDDPMFLAPKLINGDYDLLLADPRGIADMSNLTMRPLPSSPVKAITRVGHPLASRKNLKPRDLKDFPIGSVGKGVKLVIGRALGWTNNSDLDQLFSCECNSAQVLVTMVKNSDTIGIMLESNVAEEMQRNEVCVIDATEINDKVFSQYGIISYKPRILSLAAERFIDIAEELAADQSVYQ